jgi:hypothetical protein
MCWIDTYLGPPDNIVHDAGKNFASAEFRQHAKPKEKLTPTTPLLFNGCVLSLRGTQMILCQKDQGKKLRKVDTKSLISAGSHDLEQ